MELWGLLAKVLVTQMNTKKLRQQDLMIVTRAFCNAKVRSDKLYGFIVRYFLSLGFNDEESWNKVHPNMTIFFFFSLAKACPTLDNQDQFFGIVNRYID